MKCFLIIHLTDEEPENNVLVLLRGNILLFAEEYLQLKSNTLIFVNKLHQHQNKHFTYLEDAEPYKKLKSTADVRIVLWDTFLQLVKVSIEVYMKSNRINPFGPEVFFSFPDTVKLRLQNSWKIMSLKLSLETAWGRHHHVIGNKPHATDRLQRQ